ncbi:MAG: lipopolysaccharide assembly protein LapA domain-containing protein [Reyranella sp.]|nr:lipopolysaccharide assembly protein LapA domain-containing protein [Reyranella sp.]
MKILSRALFLLFVLFGVLMAVSNSQTVQLALWPLPHIIVMPVYLLVVGLLLLGVLAGLGLGWWAARHHRRRAREAGSEAARLEREVARLHGSLAAQQPAGAAVAATSPGQRAIERQRALVAPDLAAPAKRGPFS